MPVTRQSLIHCCESLLQPSLFKDASPNGLQVQGRANIEHLVTGVTASVALIERAIDLGADALMVHHGYFWKGDAAPITGMLYHRIAPLIKHDINLLAYHLPLDAHPEIGNNKALADALDINVCGPLQSSDAPSIGYWGELKTSCDATTFTQFIQERLGRQPLFVSGHDRSIHTIGWCSGAAQKDLAHAASLGLDAYLTGEASEPSFHQAKELGIHFYAAGHHATERGGIQRLGEYCAAQLGIQHTFVDIHNPI